MIKVKCPNAACGKVLTVKDEYAGKRGKCPDCGKELLIPKAGTSPPAAGSSPPKKDPKQAGPDVASKPPAKTPAPPKPSSPARQRKEDEENETEEEESRPARPSGSGRAGEGRSGKRRQQEAEEEDDEDEEEDDYDDEEDDDDDEEDDEPEEFQRRLSSDPVRAEWSKLRRGVNLIYLQMCCSLGAIGALLGGLLLAIVIGYAFEKPMAREVLWMAFQAGAGLLGLAGIIASLTGHSFCCLAPENYSARILAIASLGLAVVYVLLSLVIGFVPNPALLILWALVTVGYQIVFLFFLRALAFCVRAVDLADNIRNLLIGYGGTLGTGLIAGFVVFLVSKSVTLGAIAWGNPQALLAAAQVIGITVLMLFFLYLLVGLALFCWFLMDLVRLLEDIDKKLGRKLDKEHNPLWIMLISMDGVFIFIWLILFMVAYMKAAAPPAPQSLREHSPAPYPSPSLAKGAEPQAADC